VGLVFEAGAADIGTELVLGEVVVDKCTGVCDRCRGVFPVVSLICSREICEAGVAIDMLV